MGQDQGTGSTTVTTSQDPEQIEREIEQTREQLGDTVEALAKKADVKAQAKQKLEDTKSSVSDKKEELLGKAKEASPEGAVSAASQASQTVRQNPMPLALAGAFAAGFLTGRVFRR
jgi:ElaB/YqjD/DUF883 family membrane-anchored ribosome-binding protein